MSTSPIPLPLNDGVLYIDNSSMELFTTCPRQAELYMINRLELSRDRIALTFGEKFHAVLDYLYSTYGTAYRSTTDNVDVLRFAATQVIPTPEDDYRTTPYLVSAVERYLTDYPAEPWTIATLPSGKPAIEVPFMYPLGTIDTVTHGRVTIVWVGRIDLIYRSGNRLGVMDHKTTSMMGPQFFGEFEISHQMYGYKNAAEHILGEAVTEITINGLGCRKPTCTGKTYEFSRHVIPTVPALADEWHRDCLTIVANFIHCAEEGYFPRHTKWCIGKYGPCQYRAVCASDPSMRPAILATSEFRPVTWSPLNPKQPSPNGT